MPKPDKNLDQIIKLQDQQHKIVKKHSKPTAILFIDLSDSTSYKFNTYLPEGISRAYHHNTLASQCVYKYGGHVIKWLGDGVLACFDLSKKNSKSEAPILCAIEFQKGLQLKNKSFPSRHQFHTKIGIHFGEDVFWSQDNDVLGKDVDITARIQARCLDDQILISQQYLDRCDMTTVRKVLDSDKEIVQCCYKNLSLRGVKTPLTLYGVVWDNQICSAHRASNDIEPLFALKNVIAKEDFIKIEKGANKVAWIMSPTLQHDLHYAKDDVISNMKRGVIYHYIVPDTMEIRTTIKRLKKLWSSEGIEVKANEEECKAFFTILPPYCVLNTVLVYDPYETSSSAIVMLPTNEVFPPSQYLYGFYISDIRGVNYYTGILAELFRSKCAKT